MMRHILDTTLICFLLTALIGQHPSGCKPQQGITGKILFESGNQMPSPGLQREPAKGVKRELLVYDLINRSKLEEEGNGFYREPEVPPVKTVISEADGSFSIRLEPGKYSLFVREKEQLYANLSDGEGNIFPVEVEKGKMTQLEFKISYDAYY